MRKQLLFEFRGFVTSGLSASLADFRTCFDFILMESFHINILTVWSVIWYQFEKVLIAVPVSILIVAGPYMLTFPNKKMVQAEISHYPRRYSALS